jgi:hypothetical protein
MLSVALLPIVDFLEDDPDQAPILSNQFFCRYFFNTNEANFSIIQYISSDAEMDPSSPSRRNECSCCGEPYSPEELDPRQVMHWCPRPHCRRAHHRTCLIDSAHYTTLTAPHDLVCARLASSADTDEPVVMPDDETMFDWLPLDLLRLAAQPIVRGGVHGVAGNVAAVVRARRVVHAAFRALDSESRHIIDTQFDLDLDLDFWEEDPGFVSWEEAIVETHNGASDEGKVVLVCPACAGAV